MEEGVSIILAHFFAIHTTQTVWDGKLAFAAFVNSWQRATGLPSSWTTKWTRGWWWLLASPKVELAWNSGREQKLIFHIQQVRPRCDAWFPLRWRCAWWALMVKLLGKIQCFCTLCAFDHLQCVEIRGRSSLVMVGLAHLWPSIIPTSQHPTCPMWTLALCPSERSSESSGKRVEDEHPARVQSQWTRPSLPHSTFHSHCSVAGEPMWQSQVKPPAKLDYFGDKRPRCGWCVYRAELLHQSCKETCTEFLVMPVPLRAIS